MGPEAALNGPDQFELTFWDYLAFGAFFVVLSAIGYWAGRRERSNPSDYFLAGRKLPWYVVGGSFIASNISSEHFIGMIGAAFIFGQCVAMSCWGNVLSFSFLIWLFIPFLLASKVFTIPEFLERRFNSTLRQFFAVVTVLSNVLAFLAAVLYGGGLALNKLFGWDLWFAIILLGVVAGTWAIYGGLSSVAWTDLFTVIVMILGGVLVTILGLQALAGDSGSPIEGFRVMIERNHASGGVWREAVEHTAQNIVHADQYNRLSVIQPVTHELQPWTNLFFGVFTVSIWYNVLNQFMIQRVLGAKNAYHARMGIVLAGFTQVFLPAIIVIPGLILFAMHPEVLLLPWEEVPREADQTFISLVQALVPVGLRGLVLAGLFGAIQSTVNSVLNSTATIVTLDIYKRLLRPNASSRDLVTVGIATSVVVLLVAIVLAGFIGHLGESLFVYIQTLYAFFAPPFSAVFLLGILWRRINATGATAAVFSGFALYIAIKVYVGVVPSPPAWLMPYANQAAVNWVFCVLVCVAVSLATPRPSAERVTDQLILNWKMLNIFSDLGTRWYTSVVTWWCLFVLLIVTLVVIFSPVVLR
ncbi:MAG: sodium/solute symporter [Planctomycetes bacterium]|nr:sodium/solute symporter [Planctomycetota bacterium]MBL7040860.1 sodium/solute symporter [Pirellulaceae bacterium]